MPIPITDLISTTSPSDVYATHDASLGKGGHRTVDTYNDMLAITDQRRAGGMQVHVLETDKLYKLSTSLDPWSVISSNVLLFAQASDIVGVTTLKVNDYVYFNDTQTVHIIQENLQPSAAISGALPSYMIRTVADNTVRDAIPKEDRFIGMVVYSTAQNKHYKLLGFFYNANGQFTPSVLDWQEINYSPDILVVNDISDVLGLSATESWPSRHIFIINEAKYIRLSRTGNEWEEVPKSDTPYYVVDNLAALQLVPPFYRQPGLMVFVIAENKIYTRNAANDDWVPIAAEGTAGLDGRGIVDCVINFTTGELNIEYTDGIIDNVGIVVGQRGDDGISIVNVELYEDPLVPGSVYISTTLSNGTTLRTTDSLAGYNGSSVNSVVVVNNELIFTLDDGTPLPAVPVSGIVSISGATIDPGTGDLIIHYTDGTSASAGASAGLAGRSVTDTYIIAGELFFEFDRSPGPNVPVKIGNIYALDNVYFHKGSICVTYNYQGTQSGTAAPGATVSVKDVNGVEINEVTADGSGNWSSPDAVAIGTLKWVEGISLTGGTLYATYSDDPNTNVPLGDVISVTGAGISPTTGELIFTTSKPGTSYNVGEISTITDARAEPNRDLVFVTSIPDINTASGFREINIGPVDNLKGKSIQSVALVSNELIFTLDDGTPLNPVPVSGLTPISIVDAEIVAGDLILELSDGTFISAGVATGLKTREIVSFTLSGDELTVLFDDSSTEIIPNVKYIDTTSLTNGRLYIHYTTGEVQLVGTVPGIADLKLDKGELSFSLTTDPLTYIPIGIIKSVERTAIENGVLVFYYEDAPTTPVLIGNVAGIEDIRITGGNLIVDYTDSRKNVNLGYIIGPQGPKGWSITNAFVDSGGNLIVNTDDPQNAALNAGFVRTTIQNLIGQTEFVTAVTDQTEFMFNHTGEVLVFKNEQLLPPTEYNLNTSDRIILNTPCVAGDRIQLVVYAAGGPSATGRGIFNLTANAGIYTITLEDGTPFVIDTNTPVNPATLPPGINTITVLPNGDIQVFLTDGTDFIAGSANNAVSIVNATVDPNGDLIIETDDPANQFINAGSVLSGLQITNANVDVNGHLIFTTNTGTFDAGPAANYVTGANIDNITGELTFDMSIGGTINAGVVRNPLLGEVSDFLCFAGQTDFPVEHNGYEVIVYANGVALSKTDVITTNPAIVKLVTPRAVNDIVKIMLLSSGTVIASEVTGAASAPVNTYYGKDTSGALGFHPASNLRSVSTNDFVATAGQDLFFITHNGGVEVIVNGVYLMSDQYTLPNSERVELVTPLNAGDKVRINVLTAPVGANSLLHTQYAHFKYLESNPGGTALRGAWRPRNLSTITESSIPGAIISRSSAVLPAGRYFVRGWATANGVGANAIRLYNTTTQTVLLQGESVFAGSYNSTSVSKSPTLPNTHAPVEGYFELPMQSAIQVQHRVVRDVTTYGFGVVGGGTFEGSGYSISQPNTASNAPQSDLGFPATLVDIQFWKVA